MLEESERFYNGLIRGRTLNTLLAEMVRGIVLMILSESVSVREGMFFQRESFPLRSFNDCRDNSRLTFTFYE